MKTVTFYTVVLSVILGFGACATAKMDKELAKQIRSDERLKIVSAKAEELIQNGLNAGDSYNEIWIRDLNTFIELACKVSDTAKIREALLTFFKFQGQDGNIVDGYVPKEKARISYNYIYSDLAPEFGAHKNTVETDQESSLIQAIAKYIRVMNDRSFLNEVIDGKTVTTRMEDALNYLMQHRYNEKYGLLWGATTADWGDVQPEHEWGVELDQNSHLAIDIYDNAMFIIALNDYLSLTEQNQAHWQKIKETFVQNTRKQLWDPERQKFIPHIYLDGSPSLSRRYDHCHRSRITQSGRNPNGIPANAGQCKSGKCSIHRPDHISALSYRIFQKLLVISLLLSKRRRLDLVRRTHDPTIDRQRFLPRSLRGHFTHARPGDCQQRFLRMVYPGRQTQLRKL